MAMTGSIIPEKAHSRIGPSSFARAEACPSSAILAAALDPLPASIFAAEGTAAHQVFEECLVNDEDPVEHVDRAFMVGPHQIICDLDMAENLGPAVQWVKALDAERKEYEVKLSIPRTSMYGYADVISYEDILHVIDLKYGAGIPVPPSAVQLQIYGLMALMDMDLDVLRVGPGYEVVLKTTVLQPRSAGNSPHDCMDSHYWTRDEMIGLLDRIFETIEHIDAGRMRYQSGSHCQFCPAVGVCPLLKAQAHDVVMADTFADPDLLNTMAFDKETLEDSLDVIPQLDLWARRIEELGRLYLENGGVLRNRKLVEKRATRKWSSEESAVEWLKKHGVDPYAPAKVKTPPQAEKGLAKNLQVLMNKELVVKESSGLTTAPMDDRRPAVLDKAKAMRAAKMSEEAKRRLSNATKKEGGQK